MKSILRARVRLLFPGLTVIGVAFPLVWWQLHATPSAPHASAPTPPSSYGQVPLSFEANHGQANEPVQFLARGTNATLYLTPTEAALEVEGGLGSAERSEQSSATRRAISNLPSPICYRQDEITRGQSHAPLTGRSGISRQKQ